MCVCIVFLLLQSGKGISPGPNLDKKWVWLSDTASSWNIKKNYFVLKPLRKVWIGGVEISSYLFSVKSVFFC